MIEYYIKIIIIRQKRIYNKIFNSFNEDKYSWNLYIIHLVFRNTDYRETRATHVYEMAIVKEKKLI